MSHSYTIERHTHGWLLCAPPSRGGVPQDALAECGKIFPQNSVLDLGIPQHFNAAGRMTKVVSCIGTPKDLHAWRAEIESSLQHLDPEDRWWRGLDVGASSAALFAVFCRPSLRFAADHLGRASVPRDASDFGRCKRLLQLFPDWRNNLHRVAEAYPETKWPALVARWPELEAADCDSLGEILITI